MSASQPQLDAIAIFSHPDDAELSVAGTLLKLKQLGYRTAVIDMTRGEMGTRGTPEIRAAEAEAAATAMNLDLRLNLGLPDGHIWLNDESRTAVVRLIRQYQPKLLLTTHWDDPHPDHANTARIVREAAASVPQSHGTEVLFYEDQPYAARNNLPTAVTRDKGLRSFLELEINASSTLRDTKSKLVNIYASQPAAVETARLLRTKEFVFRERIWSCDSDWA